jgi:hypothetical protein
MADEKVFESYRDFLKTYYPKATSTVKQSDDHKILGEQYACRSIETIRQEQTPTEVHT